MRIKRVQLGKAHVGIEECEEEEGEREGGREGGRERGRERRGKEGKEEKGERAGEGDNLDESYLNKNSIDKGTALTLVAWLKTICLIMRTSNVILNKPVFISS